MVKIIDTKATGKTKKLFSLAQENNGIIVCNNPSALHVKAQSYGIFGIDFISYFDFIDKQYDTTKKVYIDEIEEFIKYFSSNVDGYTLSLES